jgi:hypothetical protein
LSSIFKSSKGRGRRLQFRLRTLLIAIVVAALALALLIPPAQSQRRSRLWVLSQRGMVVLNPKYRLDGDWYVSKTSWPLPRQIVDTLGVDLFASVKIVILDCDEIYDLSGVTGLVRLEELHINQHIHSSTDFNVLRSLRHLRKITFTKWSGLSRDRFASIAKALPGVECVLDE